MLLLSVSLVLLTFQDPAQSTAPDAKLVEETVAAVRAALGGSETAAKVKALEAASSVPAPDVVDAVAKAFRDDEKEVKNAAIQSLRWMDHPEALDTLHAILRKDRAIKKDDELTTAALKAIGQHGDPRSIDVLANDAFGTKNHRAIQARVLGLGMIRDRKSVEALLGLMKTASERIVDRYMDDLRLSLVMLTGTDQGPSSGMWQRWWNDHRKGFEVSPDRPEVPRPMAMRWVRYWGLEEDYGRTKRREDRGDDPERRGRAGQDGR